MTLTSSSFFVFLAAIFLLYWPLSRFRIASLAVLLTANYFFYAKYDFFYLALIPLASLADYSIGLGLGASKSKAVRKLLVRLSVVMHLCILASFKYMPFLLESWAGIARQPAPKWDWVFPLGISFFCFQSLTYTIDLYRNDGKPVRSLLAHFTAVSFFPTTLSGPITRVLALAPQLEKPGRRLEAPESGRAFYRIGMGLLKKYLIADFLSENLVTRVFDTPNLYTGLECLVAVYAYAVQLYYDFSGYTDIAIGSAMLLGLKLPENFNRPYQALNISEFWRRWHISLSNWLRDYLYFSLPGKRNRLATLFNLFVWGALHGAALAVHHAWRTWRGNPAPAENWIVRQASRLLTAHFVILAWVFFRASSLDNAHAVLSRIASLTASLANISVPLATVLMIAAVAHYFPRQWSDRSVTLFSKAPFFAQAALLAALIVAIQYVAVTGAAPFLYTQF